MTGWSVGAADERDTMASDRPQVTIYTDGACIGNPGPGGWAAIVREGRREQLLQGGASHTTNNRMEMRAAIAALRALRRPSLVHLHTDSEYLKLGITTWLPRWQRNGWQTARKTPVKNKDLWQALVAAEAPHDVRWIWVKGHADDPQNKRADQLARLAVETIGRGASPDLEQPSAAPRRRRST
jgi:ribonuclease HI